MDKGNAKKEYGEVIRNLRIKAGLTQAELASRIDVHEMTLRRWEQGVREPKAREIRRLCEVLGCSEAELLNGSAKQEFEVKIVMGVKNLTGLAGVEIMDNSFLYGVQDDEPQIHIAGKVRIDTPELREKALDEIIRKFKKACWMFDHKDDAEI